MYVSSQANQYMQIQTGACSLESVQTNTVVAVAHITDTCTTCVTFKCLFTGGLVLLVFWSIFIAGGAAEFLRLVRRYQRIDEFIEIPIHYFVDLVKGEAYPVVGDPALREVLGSDPFASFTGPDLGSAGLRYFRLLLLLCHLV